MTHRIPYLWECGEGNCCYQFMILETSRSGEIIKTIWKGLAMTNTEGDPGYIIGITQEFLNECRNNNIDCSHIVTQEGELVERSI